MFVRHYFKWLIAAAALATAGAYGQDKYPDHPVRVMVPFDAGTSTDVVGRAVARSLGEATGQGFVVLNRPGALGTIGAAEVARSSPDGYTLLLGSSTSMSAGPQQLKNHPPYDAEKDFVPIARIAGTVFTLVVRSELGANSLDEFLEIARRRGEGQHPLAWGYGNSANQAASSVLVQAAKINAVPIPYKGVPSLLQDMLGGRIDFAIIDLPNALPLVKAGRLRALAVSTPKPIDEFPGVPPLNTVAKDFELLVWSGLFVPKGTPQPVIDYLSRAMQSAMKNPELIAALKRTGTMVFYGDGPELAAYMKNDIARWTELMKIANIQPE